MTTENLDLGISPAVLSGAGTTGALITAGAGTGALLSSVDQGQGPQGQPGPPGPQGEIGPQGPAGGSTSIAEYQFKTAITTPPASGEVRLNNASQAAATAVYLHGMTWNNTDLMNAFRAIASPTEIYIQDQNDSTVNQHYQASANAIDHGTWVEVPVTWMKGGTALVNQSGQATSIVGLITQGKTGPQGPPGLWTQMTQAAYDALPVKDPNTLYVIVG